MAQALSAFLGQPAGLLAKLGGQSGAAQDLWLAHGKAHPLPINACGYGENDPFAALKKFGGAA